LNVDGFNGTTTCSFIEGVGPLKPNRSEQRHCPDPLIKKAINRGFHQGSPHTFALKVRCEEEVVELGICPNEGGCLNDSLDPAVVD
jgi:hypothetical protein